MDSMKLHRKCDSTTCICIVILTTEVHAMDGFLIGIIEITPLDRLNLQLHVEPHTLDIRRLQLLLCVSSLQQQAERQHADFYIVQ